MKWEKYILIFRIKDVRIGEEFVKKKLKMGGGGKYFWN